ncbi:hypothetical protein BB560_003014 [Smittium megazygosporum]|uniref:2Fe-2S ferredoxin n=1 Tax=Smittium megazygosporum TaxID=133381 RepID=A0A2T9ZDA9_9FUNG|nr:hypothetical protein BB560_003014 [Smittium megazygosporum]
MLPFKALLRPFASVNSANLSRACYKTAFLQSRRSIGINYKLSPRLLLSHHFSSTTSSASDKVNLTFVTPEGEEIPVEAEKGINILELAHENDVDLEGACECSCACSTCHVILEEKLFDKLEEPSDEELDMLDLAFGLTETSRLGCQINVNDDFEGAKIRLPAATRNFYVDGAKPAKH